MLIIDLIVDAIVGLIIMVLMHQLLVILQDQVSSITIIKRDSVFYPSLLYGRIEEYEKEYFIEIS